MGDLIPYLGITLVIAVGGLAIGMLARYGLRLRRFKHDKTELEFETSEPSAREDLKKSSLKHVHVTEELVHLSDYANTDCKALGIEGLEAVQFVIGEAARHPILFRKGFNSLPLIFGRNVLLLSWDEERGTIERILNRSQAYPLNDIWSSCLASYREAALLPYRSKGPEGLFLSGEAKRVLDTYRRLVSNVGQFLLALEKQGETPPAVQKDMESLVWEAEFALANDDIGRSIARLEVILSTTHKLILQFAPQGPLTELKPVPPIPEEKLLSDGGVRVLVVEDHFYTLRHLAEFLRELGCAVFEAGTTSEAMRALIENEFDLVITDLVMPTDPGESPQMDGREVALAVKKSNPKTRIFLVTAYSQMSRIAELLEVGIIDGLISKTEPSWSKRIETIVQELSPEKSSRIANNEAPNTVA